ncbi:MAG: hypothetical protein DI539_01400 [Flavobacterium psychrophilum]|nr:MAG: hypothetical protein DI539_01400 [Flavobacterium psychrophilum]
MKNFLFIFILFNSLFIYSQNSGLYKFEDASGKYGFIDKSGNIIIDPEYLWVSDFNDGRAFVSKENGTYGRKWICIDTLGNKIFDLGNNWMKEDFSEGFAVVQFQDEYWFIDKEGNKAFNKTYADVRSGFKQGYAIVSDEKFKNFYYIDKKGKKCEKLPSGHITIFNKNGYAVNFDNGYYVTDTLGNKIGEKQTIINGSSEGLFKVQKNNKWGFMNISGTIAVDYLYDEDERNYSSNEDSPKKKLKKSGLKNVSLFHEGLASFQRDSLYGFIDKTGKIVIEPQFKGIGWFSEGLAGASLDGKLWGFIDETGKFILNPIYYKTDAFEKNICAVRIHYVEWEMANDYYFDAIIDKLGNILNKVEMHCYLGFNNDLIEYYGGPHFTGGVHYLNNKAEHIVPKKL